MTLHFLDLPAELILRCLLLLSLDDMVACLYTCTALRALISDSIAIQYRVALERAGLEENPSSLARLPISERMNMLRRREERWRTLTPASRHTIRFPAPSMMFFYDLKANYWLLALMDDVASEQATALKYIDIRPVDVHLLSFSTSTPHPLAAEPTIHLGKRSTEHVVEAKLDVLGHILVITTVNWERTACKDENLLYFFNWKTGLPLKEPVYTTTAAVIFAAPNVVLAPSAKHNRLEVYGFPPEGDSHEPEVFMFDLPALLPSHHINITQLQCRISPSPRTTTTHTQYCRADFLPTTENAVILLSYDTFLLDDDNDDEQPHIFAILPYALLECIDEQRTIPAENRPTCAWAAWGPRSSRWLDPSISSRAWITVTSGQRALGFAPYRAISDEPPVADILRLLDFNPHQIRHCRRHQPADSENSATTRRIVEPLAGTPSEDLARRLFSHFAEPVSSQIAYVETTSKELFCFHNIYMSDDCLVGITYAPENELDSLEIMYFG
ncbi:hypothetical protein MKEN_00554000 [Mycena kentingensis (nom. inval.)]|nr:hypothetical protein MKEN_00554000 [Mycena kentingensis (nom. inval.)]